MTGAPEADRLVELAKVTRDYAAFGSGQARGLRLLPGAAAALVAGVALAVSPRVGFFASLLVPVALLVGPSLWKGPYQRFGRVEPFSYVRPPRRWPMWALAGGFWLLGVLQLFARRGELASTPGATVGFAVMFVALAVLAPLVRRTAEPVDAYAAGFLAAYLPQFSGSWIAPSIWFGALGVVMAGYAIVEHRRFRALEARMARLREPA